MRKITDMAIRCALRRQQIWLGRPLTLQEIQDRDFLLSIRSIGPKKADVILNDKNPERFLTFPNEEE